MQVCIEEIGGGWTLQNNRFTMEVNRETGEVAGFDFHGLKPVPMTFSDYDAQVDDLAALVADPVTRTEVVSPGDALRPEDCDMEWDVAAVSQVPPRLRLTRRSAASPASFTIQWTLHDDFVEVQYELAGFPPEQNKPGVTVDFPLPGFKGRWNWKRMYSCWAPVLAAPFEGMFGVKVFQHPGFVYSEDAIPIGLVTVYERSLNIGLSFAIPVEDRVAASITVDQRRFTVQLRLHSETNPCAGRAVYRFCLAGHEGCWRPGMKWFYERWRGYFEPVNDNIWQTNGSYLYAYPSPGESYIRYLAEKMDLKWVELAFYPDFGKPAPEEERWDVNFAAGPAQPDRVLRNVGWPLLREHTAMLRKHGVHGFAYFNLYECEHSLTDRFPDSVICNCEGQPQRAWSYPDGKRYNLMLNPSPRLSWGQHLIRQARRLFEQLPDLAGLFIDNNNFGGFDFARHDGFTFANGKPAFNLTIAYDELHDEIDKVIAEFGRMSWCNCGSTLRRTRRVGGIMSEGVAEGLGKFLYFCIHKPLLLLGYDGSEKSLQYALRCGAQMAVKPATHFSDAAAPRTSPENEALYAAYLPMLRLLRRRKLVLHPNPLTLPVANGMIKEPWGRFDRHLMEGDIFEMHSGDYAVALVDMLRSSQEDSGGFRKDLPFLVRVPDTDRIARCVVLGAEYRGFREVPFTRRSDGALHLTVPVHGAASLVVLAKDGSDILSGLKGIAVEESATGRRPRPRPRRHATHDL